MISTTKSPRGIILLVTLLTFAIAAGAALTTAAVVLGSLRSISGADRHLRAEALSEGGIEDALYHLRAEGPTLDGHEKILFTMGEIAVRSIIFGEEKFVTDLAVGATHEFGIYKPPGDVGDVETLIIDWSDVCDGASTLTIRWIAGWMPGAPSINWQKDKGITVQTFAHASAPAFLYGFDAGQSYLVQLEPGGCGLNRLTVSAYQDGGATPATSMQTHTRVLSNATVGGFRADEEELTLPYDLLPIP